MAKVSELKFNINGIDYKVNVNCNSSGEFNANVPDNVAQALRIRSKLTSDTLLGLENTFREALEKYKKIETKETLHILISYGARGNYMYNSEGYCMFGQSDKHHMNISFNKFQNAVSLDFLVAIKEDIDGKVQWFEAQLGGDLSQFDPRYSEPNKYHKSDRISSVDNYKIIPFNENALNTLNQANNKLRIVSEILYNFISQDEEQILLTLTNQKLLS